MPAYNFQKRFADDVEFGKKTQTIRKVPKHGRHPKAGDRFVAYTGMRSKNCRKLLESTITIVSNIRIDYLAREIVPEDGHWLRGEAARLFAQMDGFGSAEEMIQWFQSMYGGDEFVGILIEWDLDKGVRGA